MSNAIIFPGLGLTLSNVPEFINLGFLKISLYGLIIGLSMIAAFLWCYNECKYYNVDRDHFIDLTIITIISGIIGARLYYVIFSFDYYKNNPLSIFKVWEGGLGIYGGILLGMLAVIICCRIFKLDFWLVADIVSLGVILGQIAGRWGNFFNREAFGRDSSGLFAMRIPSDYVYIQYNASGVTIHGSPDYLSYIQVQPTFLYESALCFLIFIVLLIYRKKFNEAGLPFVKIETNYAAAERGVIKTRIETAIELIESGQVE